MVTKPPYYRKDALIIFILLVFIFAYFYQDGGWNGNSRLSLIFAIVQERRLSIDNYVDNTQLGTQTGDRAYFEGHYYSDKAIGPAVIGALIYAPLYLMEKIFNHPGIATVKWILTFLIVGLPSAIGGSLMYILCYYLSKSRFRAYLVTMAIVLGTMYLPYSVTLFSHQITASLLFSVFVMIFFLKENPGMVWRKGYLFLIGFLLGWALICEFPSAIIILALIVYYFLIAWKDHKNWQLRTIVLPFMGGIIPIGLQLLYNKLCFGNVFSLGYLNDSSPLFHSALQQGLVGIQWPNLSAVYYMTVHPTMGVFWESPVLLLSLIGAGIMLHEHRYRAEAILTIWIICSYFVIMSGSYMWWGGNAVGPRYIIPVLPFFGILLIFVPKRFNWLFICLTIVSSGQMMIATASVVGVPDTMMWKIASLRFFEYSNIYSYCLKQLLEGNFTQNLGHRLLGLNSWGSLIPLLVVITVITVLFFKIEAKAIHPRILIS
jgi:hypothetical protein